MLMDRAGSSSAPAAQCPGDRATASRDGERPLRDKDAVSDTPCYDSSMPRILVVDDEPDVRELVEALLAGHGYEIDGADGGKVALERLAEHAYDLVVSDLRMPDVDGVALYQAVQTRPAPRPAMLFMSGFTNAAEFVPFLRETGTPVVAKPFDVKELRSVVQRLVGQE
jgi:CheY-like chemotaxis protein